MKAILKKIYWNTGKNSIFVTWVVNFLRYGMTSIRYLRWRYKEHLFKYSNVQDKLIIPPPRPFLDDRSFNFLFRILVESRYTFAIEIGAFSCVRSARIAQLLPEITVYALDITKDYLEEQAVYPNLILGQNNNKVIQQVIDKNKDGKGLFFSSGTLCYYDYDSVIDLLRIIRQGNLDIALDEPNASITEQSRPVSLRRTSLTWYHPYISMLASAGYQPPERGGQQTDHTWGRHTEERTLLFAKVGSSE